MFRRPFRYLLIAFLATASLMAATPMVPGLAASSPLTVEVSLLVTVLDASGAPIKDLTAAEFTVFEDGVAREVTGATLATEPLFVSLLVDTTKAPMGSNHPTRDLRVGLLAFVTTLHAATPDSQIQIMEFGGAGVQLVNFTANPIDLQRTISRIVPSQRVAAVLLEAMIDSGKALAKKPGPRRAMVTVDLGSADSSGVQPSKTVEEVRKSGASVWSVSVQDAYAPGAPGRDSALGALAQATGGLRLTGVAASGLEPMLRSVANSLTAQYVVTYTRPDGSRPTAIQPVAKRGAKFLMAPWVQ